MIASPVLFISRLLRGMNKTKFYILAGNAMESRLRAGQFLSKKIDFFYF